MLILFLRGKKIEYEITESGCWIVTNYKPDKDGYIKLTFWNKDPNKIKGYLAHRLMYCKVHKIDIEDLENCVCHSCDNPLCIRPKHLWNGTKTDNNLDRDIKGRDNKAKGDLHYLAKLTEKKVLIIRAKKGIFTQEELAEQHGVSLGTIQKIHQNKTWKHI